MPKAVAHLGDVVRVDEAIVHPPLETGQDKVDVGVVGVPLQLRHGGHERAHSLAGLETPHPQDKGPIRQLVARPDGGDRIGRHRLAVDPVGHDTDPLGSYGGQLGDLVGGRLGAGDHEVGPRGLRHAGPNGGTIGPGTKRPRETAPQRRRARSPRVGADLVAVPPTTGHG